MYVYLYRGKYESFASILENMWLILKTNIVSFVFFFAPLSHFI